MRIAGADPLRPPPNPNPLTSREIHTSLVRASINDISTSRGACKREADIGFDGGETASTLLNTYLISASYRPITCGRLSFLDAFLLFFVRDHHLLSVPSSPLDIFDNRRLLLPLLHICVIHTDPRGEYLRPNAVGALETNACGARKVLQRLTALSQGEAASGGLGRLTAPSWKMRAAEQDIDDPNLFVIPKQIQSITDGFRVLTTEKETELEANINTPAVTRAPREMTHVKVFVSGIVKRNDRGETLACAGIFYQTGDPRNRAIQLPVKSCQTVPGAEAHAVLLCIKQNDPQTSMTIYSKRNFIRNAMTSQLPKWEDRGWIGVAEKLPLKALAAELKARTAKTFFVTLEDSENYTTTEREGCHQAHLLALEGQRNETSDQIDIQVQDNLKLKGAKLSTLTQALAYSGIKALKAKASRPATDEKIKQEEVASGGHGRLTTPSRKMPAAHPPGLLHPMRRGRSREVSKAAIERKRDELAGNSRCNPSRSPSPTSSTSSPRTPTPPLTLCDQVHIAYADDDLHRAKVLLLRLQGIDISSDDDPRIAAVSDSDFDACFVPFGLDDGRGQPSSPSSASSDSDRRRFAALKEKEQLWESEARRYSEERNRCLALKRPHSDRMRATAASLEAERVRLIKQKEAAAAAVDLRRRRTKPTARTLNFSLVPPVPQPPARFTYDFPFTPRNSTAKHSPPRASHPRAIPPPAPPAIPPRRAPKEEEDLEQHEANRVPFPQVLAAMHGELFPLLPFERLALPLSLSRSADGAKARRQQALLDALLAHAADVSAVRKGKGRAEPRRCVCTPSPSTTSSGSGLSRAGSWLSSFSSSSRNSTLSTSTAASSVPSSHFDAPLKSPLRLWLPDSRRTASPSPSSASPSFCACTYARAPPREPVAVHPLVPSAPTSPPPAYALPNRGGRARSAEWEWDGRDGLRGALGRMVAVARNLQAAYVRAVVVGYGGVSEGWDEDEYDSYGSYEHAEEKAAPPHVEVKETKERARCTLKLRPEGVRARGPDVRAFLAFAALSAAPPASPPPSPTHSSHNSRSSPSPPSSPTAVSEEQLVPVTPLTPLPSSSQRIPALKTELPSKLPYARAFAPPVALPRSPWAVAGARRAEGVRLARGEVGVDVRAVALVEGGGASADSGDGEGSGGEEEEGEWAWKGPGKRRPVLRARAVPNSAFLRVRALHNSVLVHAYSLAHDAHSGSTALPHFVPSDSTANASSGSKTQEPPELPRAPAPRRPREALVALGVDRAPGSGLRFVWAGAASAGC
ncbi:hypothetical protein DFH07DRAFT_959604 [Mycena maculata]|uniref:Uncharacterized protein n=1 Tax=Mycena maculata TaxID=230809 RepID=A0AAD7J332_9AGAR|nr:hypothetical protein DFH07DRAFT_959604 [Mycena maculata]